MPVQLSYGGASWRLPKEWTLESTRDEIKKAMTDRLPLPIDLVGGATLILNPALLGYVEVLDDQGDPGMAPASWSQDSMVTSGTGVISSNPYGVISSNPYGVISSNPYGVISSGAGSITISWSAGPTGR